MPSTVSTQPQTCVCDPKHHWILSWKRGCFAHRFAGGFGRGPRQAVVRGVLRL